MNERFRNVQKMELDTLFAIIPKADFQQEEKYCNFLSAFEQENGEIDQVIIRRCKNLNDAIILQVKIKTHKSIFPNSSAFNA